MIALGIDAATKTGWAKVERAGNRERLLDWGVLDFKKFKAEPWKLPNIIMVCGLMHTERPAVAAIELPWLGKDPHATEVLCRICGRFEQAIEPHGIPVRVIRASQWQSKILGVTRMKRATLKALSMARCRSDFGVDLPEDAADAAMLAVYALRFPA